MHCVQCKRELQKNDWVASISGSIMGDEHSDSYYLCPVCRVYTIVNCRDNFTGEETIEISGPLSEQKGRERISLIRRCSEPWDKKCRCEAHREYFNDTLD